MPETLRKLSVVLLVLLLLAPRAHAAHLLVPGAPLHLTLDADAPAELLLGTDGERFLALSVEIVEAAGRLRIESSGKATPGESEGEWSWSFRTEIDPRKEAAFLMGDLPQLPEPLPLKLTLRGGGGAVRLEAVDMGALPKVEYGAAPGEIVVRGSGPGSISAVPEGGA